MLSSATSNTGCHSPATWCTVKGCKCACAAKVQLCTEGRSLLPLLLQTEKDITSKPALSQYPRPSLIPTNTSDLPREASIRFMGYSVRLLKFRCTLWMAFDALPLPSPHPDQVVAAELYDHNKDPGENHNLIGKGGLGTRHFLLGRC